MSLISSQTEAFKKKWSSHARVHTRAQEHFSCVSTVTSFTASARRRKCPTQSFRTAPAEARTRTLFLSSVRLDRKPLIPPLRHFPLSVLSSSCPPPFTSALVHVTLSLLFSRDSPPTHSLPNSLTDSRGKCLL